MDVDKTLQDKLQQITSLFPQISQRLINEVIHICYQSTNIPNVVFRLEEFTRSIWPTYRPIVIDIIDCLCDKTNETDIFLTSQFIKQFSFRLLEIITLVSMCRDIQKQQLLATIRKWKTLKIFENTLCEELESLVSSSIYQISNYVPTQKFVPSANNCVNKKTNTSTEIINIDSSSDEKSLNQQINKQSLLPKFSNSKNTLLPNTNDNLTRNTCHKRNKFESYYFSRSHSLSTNHCYSSQSFDSRNSRNRSRERSYSRSSSRDKDFGLLPRWENSRNYYHSRSLSRSRKRSSRSFSRRQISPRRYNRSERRHSYSDRRRSLSKRRSLFKDDRTYPFPEISIKEDSEPKTNQFNKTPFYLKTSREDKRQSQRKRMNELEFQAFHEIKEGSSSSSSNSYDSPSPRKEDQDFFERSSEFLCHNNVSTKVITNNVNKINTKMIQKELDEIVLQPPILEKKNETKLIKTNVVIFCDIPSSWKTKEDVINTLGGSSINSIEIIPEHRCCFVSFVRHDDAMRFKVSPIPGSGACWGKEVWMKNYIIREDGVVEIPVKMIPKDVHIFKDGTYEIY
ncbi:hypothetical protein EDI_168560 [Entamoeba dispar SAW760]|uniref:CID domain-containing protein n=1 Tax=Entamoeba dispar (strain ATCC PRA-260 / SAW760) TaxID=370354 RepID=B0EKQ8_ENTDS|nr:uncharacterized protein EDI_168560 [Entamoeba dispar SAW760]EDR24889.1 hypothetical protein EDI_168560 [Entamoeba dispar SAW760]|eukprot:EDR24889.1 hypothetical protein EDI_168560 [Entamoeba dispar SAW760]